MRTATRAQIINDAQEIIICTGQFSPYDLGVLANRHRLTMRGLCNILEGEAIPTGTYERVFVDGGLKVREVMRASSK